MAKRSECDECGGKINRKIISYKVHNIKIGDFPAEVCQKCGEICFEEEISKKISLKVKKIKICK